MAVTATSVVSLRMSQFWYCLKHHAVEGPDGCKAKDRLGPYDSEAEASRALDKVEERNEAWDGGDATDGDDAEGEPRA
jgi:hypothetical protein